MKVLLAAASMKSLSLEVLWAFSGADQMDVDWNAAKYSKEEKIKSCKLCPAFSGAGSVNNQSALQTHGKYVEEFPAVW